MSTIQESAAETQAAATVDAPPKKAMGLGPTASWVMLIVFIILPLFVRIFVIFQITMVLIYGIAVLALNILTGGSGQFSLGQSAFYAIGAIAGILIAPVVFLEPNMMLGVLLYGFAAAVLGGLTSPLGAVLGGFLVGIFENLVGTYIPGVGNELKLPIALALIVIVLVVKPTGLMGRAVVKRV